MLNLIFLLVLQRDSNINAATELILFVITGRPLNKMKFNSLLDDSASIRLNVSSMTGKCERSRTVTAFEPKSPKSQDSPLVLV